MTMRATTEQYYDDGIKQAKKLFDQLYPRRAHGVDLTMDAISLGERIDGLPGCTLLQAAVADLWLRLSQKEGMDRRKVSPPPSPFQKIPGRGNAKWATKDKITKWDAAWHLRESASGMRQRMMKSGASSVSSASAILQRKLMWLVQNGDVLGWIEDLDVAAFEQAKIEDLSISTWTVEQALHQPWRNPDEQDLWVSRFEAGHRYLEAEVKRLALASRARSHVEQELGADS